MASVNSFILNSMSHHMASSSVNWVKIHATIATTWGFQEIHYVLSARQPFGCLIRWPMMMKLDDSSKLPSKLRSDEYDNRQPFVIGGDGVHQAFNNTVRFLSTDWATYWAYSMNYALLVNSCYHRACSLSNVHSARWILEWPMKQSGTSKSVMMDVNHQLNYDARAPGRVTSLITDVWKMWRH